MWHWLDVEYWGQSWPNIFAPSVWTVLAIVISHVRLHRQRERHHRAEMSQRAAGPGEGDGARDG